VPASFHRLARDQLLRRASTGCGAERKTSRISAAVGGYAATVLYRLGAFVAHISAGTVARPPVTRDTAPARLVRILRGATAGRTSSREGLFRRFAL
jgi:hypothetical protein